ncbi:bifunctional hydroxymethylpyrimidine kinase/phosphomethylpyrimidine kinase [Latilactobacillus sakei]|uniref:bifunctional hydroxymethylpyrimidine kinase/phosphomethylpyrimidine kinase n=1 Tax=Latilactobacillus sakei TaxID=1599 RepID=UPI0024DFD955|nr:bifunctional hydroxymethylpyrimidine kinase/phosphomethylpyrimidine kinase [Latilactobacillus sakei]
MLNSFPQVMTIAGSDSDGSAGAQADLNTFFARGVYGMSVLTACVAGNSFGIHASQALTPEFINAEFEAIAADFKVRACKTGMLTDSETIMTVAKQLKQHDFGPLVLDPVIITKHGALLLADEAYQTLKTELIPMATVLTPNFYEAQKLTGITLNEPADFQVAAEKLLAMGAKNVMIKGHHAAGQSIVTDYVRLADGQEFWLSEPYIETTHINGTGDSLSSCICAEIAKGHSIEDAIKTAKKFVHTAIANPIDVGHKYGPINHHAQ